MSKKETTKFEEFDSEAASNHIGVKQIEAYPFEKDGVDGYKVRYSDGYVSWSPKDQFDKSHLRLEKKNTISQSDVDGFIKNKTTETISERTTVTLYNLINGFRELEHTSCVDPKNYDEKYGEEINDDHVKEKIWKYLGFLLQTATNGFKK